jgi:hypothetical protein
MDSMNNVRAKGIMDWLTDISLYLSVEDVCELRTVAGPYRINPYAWQRIVRNAHRRRMGRALQYIGTKECTFRSVDGEPSDTKSIAYRANYNIPTGSNLAVSYINDALTRGASMYFWYDCECEASCGCAVDCQDDNCSNLQVKCNTHKNCPCEKWDRSPAQFLMYMAMPSSSRLRSPTDNYQMVEVVGAVQGTLCILSVLLPSEILDFGADRKNKIKSNWRDYLA